MYPGFNLFSCVARPLVDTFEVSIVLYFSLGCTKVELAQSVGDIGEFVNVLETGFRNPGFDSGPPPICPNESDGNFGLLIQGSPKKIGDGRESADTLWGTTLPRTGCIVFGCTTDRISADIEETDFGVIAIGNFFVNIGTVLEVALPVLLTAQKPYITNKYI